VVGDPDVQAVAGPWAFNGAFPQWDAQARALYWADTLAPGLRVCDGTTDRELAGIESPITGIARRGDDFVVAHESGAVRVTRAGESAPLTAWPHGKLLALCNAKDASLWAALASGAGCAIGLIQPGGQFEAVWQLDEHIECLCWDAAGERLCATAPASGSLLALVPGVGAVRRLVTVPKGSGRVSGLAPDPQGGLWTALRDGWSVVRISADGSLDRVVGLPVPCPTGVAIGGPLLDVLYITTARQPLSLDTLANAPLSGRLLKTNI
jgi:IclR family transcriptional regulator, acetate operon repressor